MNTIEIKIKEYLINQTKRILKGRKSEEKINIIGNKELNRDEISLIIQMLRLIIYTELDENIENEYRDGCILYQVIEILEKKFTELTGEICE